MTTRRNYFNVLFFTCVVSVSIDMSHGQLPSSITPCHTPSDPKINECFLRETRKFRPEFVKGIPELGIPSMDPLYFESDEFTIAGITSKSRDGRIKGFKECEIEDIKMDFKNKKLTTTTFGNFTIQSKHQMKGKLLNIPLNIDGNLHLKIENFRTKLIFYWDVVKGDDGKDHFYIKHHKKDLQFGNVIFNLSGLLNKQVDETMSAVLTENWRDVIKEVGGPPINSVFRRLVDIINIFYSKIPSDDLVLD